MTSRDKNTSVLNESKQCNNEIQLNIGKALIQIVQRIMFVLESVLRGIRFTHEYIQKHCSTIHPLRSMGKNRKKFFRLGIIFYHFFFLPPLVPSVPLMRAVAVFGNLIRHYRIQSAFHAE